MTRVNQFEHNINKILSHKFKHKINWKYLALTVFYFVVVGALVVLILKQNLQ